MFEGSQLINRPDAPEPQDFHEARRWRETRRRRRMLYGEWRQDLQEKLQKALGTMRREAWGEPDLSSNVFKAAYTALATLYDRGVIVHGGVGAEGVAKALAQSGVWSLMQRGQRDTLGLREMLHFVGIRRGLLGEPLPSFRPVWPDMVVCTRDSEDPSRMVRVAELVLRRGPDRRPAWTWDVWDIRDAEYPLHAVLDASTGAEGKDMSEFYLGRAGGLEGANYPKHYWRADGRPVLPYAIRHAAVTGDLWDAYEGSELVEGSFKCAIGWTFFGHVLQNASWPQRHGVNAQPVGSTIEGSEAAKRMAVVTDPTTVAMFKAINEEMPVILGQWEPGGDPQVMADSIGTYERRIAAYAGISPADVQRVAGDPRSGFAIALNLDAQREAQRRAEPVFRPADEELVALAATVLNRETGANFPEGGYRVEYLGLQPSPEARQANREQADWDIAHDQVSPIDLYLREHPGAEEEDAIAAIVKVRIDRLRLEQRFEMEALRLGLAPPPKTTPPAVPAQPPKEDAHAPQS